MNEVQDDKINWEELNQIGINKEYLQESGNYEKLLQGETTGIISLDISILGLEITMDATLQLSVCESQSQTKIEIVGIKTSIN